MKIKEWLKSISKSKASPVVLMLVGLSLSIYSTIQDQLFSISSVYLAAVSSIMVALGVFFFEQIKMKDTVEETEALCEKEKETLMKKLAEEGQNVLIDQYAQLTFHTAVVQDGLQDIEELANRENVNAEAIMAHIKGLKRLHIKDLLARLGELRVKDGLPNGEQELVDKYMIHMDKILSAYDSVPEALLIEHDKFKKLLAEKT